MKTNIKRRIMLGTAVAAIGVGPFVIRHFRKAQSLPESAWIDKVPSAMSSSGYLSVAEANFSPLALPHATDIQHSSIAACLSTDQDLVLFSYSYGNDWNVRLCYAPLSPQGVIGNFETLLDIKRPQSIITGIGCSGIKSGKISFVLRQCEPDDHDRTQCKESLFFANLVKSRQGDYFLSINDTDNGYSNPNRFLVMKRGFTALVNSNHLHWAQGTDLFFFGGRKGVDRFSPDENEPSGYTKKAISDFGESEYGSNGKQNSPSVIRSNLCNNGVRALSFMTAPLSFVDSPYSEEESENYRKRGVQGTVELGLVTGEGNRVVVDHDGHVLSQVSFPSHPYNQLSLFTQTHWCFAHPRGAPYLYSAPLDDPQNYTVFRFPTDQIFIPRTTMLFHFSILALLPDGQSLLCSRDVGISYVAEAKKEGIPPSELGIVKLPLAIG